jgi:hypothetical protein
MPGGDFKSRALRVRARRGFGVYQSESLESRRLLAAFALGPPVSTPLPAGFVPDQVLQAFSFTQGDILDGAELVTGKSGGGLITHVQPDGTVKVDQTLNTTTTVLGAVDLYNGTTNVPVIFTTAGLMTQQNNGTFAAVGGLNYPSDAVPGAYVISSGFNKDGGYDVIVERFKRNTLDPTHGDVILAAFHSDTPLHYAAEVDTTIATNVTAPPSGQAIVAADFDGQSGLDVVVDGQLWLGNNDDTFKPGPTLNLTAAEAAAPMYFINLSPPANPYTLATGLAIFPEPGASSDLVQLLLNDGQGNFSRLSSVDLGPSGSTVGPLVTNDITDNTDSDLATAVVTGPGSPYLSIAEGFGGNTFLPPVHVAVPGLVALATYDANHTALVCITRSSSGGTQSYSLTTLADKSTIGADIQLTATPSPALAGQPVTLSARVSIGPNQYPGQNMQFFDGSTQIGTSPIQSDGSAAFVTSNLAAGVHTLTAHEDYPSIGSSSLTLAVNAAPATPLISAKSMGVKIGGSVPAGASGTLRLNFANLGSAGAAEAVKVELFASTTVTLDSSATPLSSPGLGTLNLSIASHKTRVVLSSFTIPDTIPQNNYYIIARVSPGTASKATEVISATLIDPTPVNVFWGFGNVEPGRNVTFTQHLPNQGTVTFAMSGPGSGSLTLSPDVTLGSNSPNYLVDLTETTTKTKVLITQHDNMASNIANIQLHSELGALDVRQDTPLTIETDDPSNFNVGAITVGQLLVGAMPSAQRAAGAPPSTTTYADITIRGQVGLFSATTIDNGNVQLSTLGTGKPTVVKIGNLIAGHSFQSGSPISLLQMGSGQLGASITAPSIAKFTCTGEFDSNLNVTGTASGATVLGSVDISSVDVPTLGQDRWAVNGNIGKLSIDHPAKNLQLLGGAKLGPEGETANPPAAYSGVIIQSLRIGGTVASCQFFAGVDPVDGVFGNSDDKLLPGGSINSIFLGGSVSADSRFVAATLPATVTIGGQKVSTANDPRFKFA